MFKPGIERRNQLSLISSYLLLLLLIVFFFAHFVWDSQPEQLIDKLYRGAERKKVAFAIVYAAAFN